MALAAACLVIAPFTLSGAANLLTARLYDWGAKANANIAGGEWWRLLTAAFLHAGLLHLLFNLYALFVVGSLVEEVLGPARLFGIYMVAALTGSLASYTLNSHLSVGASGAIFGLMGAALVAGLRHPDDWAVLSANHWKGLFIWAAYSLIGGFTTTGIDNAAHIGGLVGGAAVAVVLVRRSHALAVAVLCAIALGLSVHRAVRAQKITPPLMAFKRGMVAAHRADLETAEKEYGRAVPYLPAMINRSGVRMLQGDIAEALADGDLVLSELGKPVRQLSPSNRALRVFSGDTLELRTMAQLARAVALLALDRDSEAIAAVDEAVDSPNEDVHFRARFVRGHLLARLGREAEALADLDRAAESSDTTMRSNAMAASAAVRHKIGPVRVQQIHDSAVARLSRVYTEAELDRRPTLVSCKTSWYNVAAPGGYVELRFILDEHGRVELRSLEVTRVALGGSGPRAVEYIGSCRYRPGLAGGLPVRTQWQQLLKSDPPVALVGAGE